MALRNVIGRYQCFGGTYCFHLQDRRLKCVVYSVYPPNVGTHLQDNMVSYPDYSMILHHHDDLKHNKRILYPLHCKKETELFLLVINTLFLSIFISCASFIHSFPSFSFQFISTFLLSQFILCVQKNLYCNLKNSVFFFHDGYLHVIFITSVSGTPHT
jgi:hypothetical protein